MKEDISVKDIIETYDDDFETVYEKLDFHLFNMYYELCHIDDALYVYKVVENEYEKRIKEKGRLGYSAIRNILYESLSYRIVLGLSKIFIGEKEFSLLKTINTISQMEEFKNNIEIKSVINEINNFVSHSDMVRIVNIYRDKVFAHLDKECIVSECRVDTVSALKNIDKLDVLEGIRLVSKLSLVCFNLDFGDERDELIDEEIINVFFYEN